MRRGKAATEAQRASDALIQFEPTNMSMHYWNSPPNF
jgi:hypothetical protein